MIFTILNRINLKNVKNLGLRAIGFASVDSGWDIMGKSTLLLYINNIHVTIIMKGENKK